MKKVKLGLVGCGGRGIYIAGLFNNHPECEVTALMDIFEAPMAKAAEQLKIREAARFTDFDAMLNQAPVDALFFGSDPTTQSRLACKAMRAGKHVCMEVPAAVELGDLQELARAVRETGCRYQLMEQTRYAGWLDYWRESVASGELGHICMAQGEYIHYERNWGYFIDTDTGEILHDLTPPEGRKTSPTWRYKILGDPIYYLPHTLSPLLRVLDDRVVSVSCMGTRNQSYTYPEANVPWRDIEYALMHTEKDTVMMVGAGFSLPYPARGVTGHHWYEIRGTGGCLESPRSRTDNFRYWKPGMDDYGKLNLSTAPSGATSEQAASGHGGQDFKPVETFVRAVLDNTEPPMDIRKAFEITAPAIIAAESARQGGALLEVPEFEN